MVRKLLKHFPLGVSTFETSSFFKLIDSAWAVKILKKFIQYKAHSSTAAQVSRGRSRGSFFKKYCFLISSSRDLLYVDTGTWSIQNRYTAKILLSYGH